jgi:hypothetical protein
VARLSKCIRDSYGNAADRRAFEDAFVADGGNVQGVTEGGKIFTDPNGGRIFQGRPRRVPGGRNPCRWKGERPAGDTWCVAAAGRLSRLLFAASLVGDAGGPDAAGGGAADDRLAESLVRNAGGPDAAGGGAADVGAADLDRRIICNW